MGTFIHHPDGSIIINDLVIPLAEFIKYAPSYVLKVPYSSRRYIQGEGHFLYTKDSQFGGEYPWKEGDTYIANIEEYRSAIESAAKNMAKEMYRAMLEVTDRKALLALEWITLYLIESKVIPIDDVPEWITKLLEKRKSWSSAMSEVKADAR